MNRQCRALARVQWDFRTVRAREWRAACVWEYARESRTLRGATSFDKFEQTNEIKWLAELCDEMGACDCPWLEAVADYKEHIRQLLNSERDVDAKPVEWITLSPITLSGPGPEPVIFLIPGQEPPPGWPKMGINPNAPRSEIQKALAGIGTRERLNYEKVTEWKARLEALGTWRLRRAGYTFGQIAALRKKHGWLASEKSLERSAKRDIKTVIDFFTAAFPFVPLSELHR